MTVVINGSTGIDTVQDGVVTDTKLNLTANSAEIKEALYASNGAPIYACRAWVNFNGTGTVAIRASGNVSSITDNGIGDYTVKFTTAMPDANYTAVLGGSSSSNGSTVTFAALAPYGGATAAPTTTAVRVGFVGSGANVAASDNPYLMVSIFR